MNIISLIIKNRWIALIIFLAACSKEYNEYYTIEDFEKVQKIDAHFHYLTSDLRFLEFAASQNFRLLSPNTDMDISVYEQWDVAQKVLETNSSDIAFLSTFSVDSFTTADFTTSTINYINQCMKEGSSGVKIWKNIGMKLRDSEGRIVMADDSAFIPIFQFLEKNNIPVMAHLGEPRNCWLPLDEMTNPGSGDMNYYKNNPQYHMYLFPQMPSYEEQIKVRDNLLGEYSDLIFVGAHLGSLEWSVDELSKRFEKYPNFFVDMSARISYLKEQAFEDRSRVRQFFIKYQDRILYGTDGSVYDLKLGNFKGTTENILKGWRSDWLFLATDSLLHNLESLKLPTEVIDKIYYENAIKLFELKNF